MSGLVAEPLIESLRLVSTATDELQRFRFGEPVGEEQPKHPFVTKLESRRPWALNLAANPWAAKVVLVRGPRGEERRPQTLGLLRREQASRALGALAPDADPRSQVRKMFALLPSGAEHSA